MKTINLKSVIKDTSQNWITDNPTLAKGNISYETDTDLIKLYDGEHSYNELPYLNAGGGEGGTTNYNVLSNKPKINSIILTGNKTLEELGIPTISEISSIQNELTALHNDFDAIDSEVGDKADNDMTVHKKGYESGETIENPKEFTGLVTLSGNNDIEIGDTTNVAATTAFVTASVDDLRNNLPSSGNIDTKIAEHNLSNQAHNDIRNSVKAVSDSLSVKANLASQDNTKIGNIATVDKDGQYEVSDTKLSELNEDIDILNQQTGLLTTSINDIKDDYVSKTKNNIIDGKNTLNGDLVIGQKDDVAANIRNGVNNKVVLTTKTLDTNIQATYIGGDQVEVYAPDAMVVETAGGLYTKKTPEGSSNPEYYEVIDRGNLSNVLHQQGVAYQNESNFFGKSNRFIRDIILDAHGGDANTGSDIKFKRGNNVDVSILSATEEPVNGLTSKLYGHTVKVEAGYSVLLNTPSIKTQRTEDGTVNTYTVLDSGNISDYVSGGSSEMEKYGIEADYAVHNGIIDCPNGLIEFNATNKNIILKAGVVLQAAGQDNRTTIGSDITYTIQETGKITLFYVAGEILEAGDVFYQEAEPNNGATAYLAWYKPSLKKWQFKSNDTGNVWRTAIATPIANVNATTTTITSINYIGYRIFDDDCFASLSDIDSVNETIATMETSIDDLFTEVDKKQNKLLSRQLLSGNIDTVSDVATDADLSTLITAFNDLLAKLRTRGIIS